MATITEPTTADAAPATSDVAPASIETASRNAAVPIERQANQSTCKPAGAKGSQPTKGQIIIKLLRRKKGATINELVNATGWQTHSVRGHISGTIKKKLLFNVAIEKDANSVARYRIVTGEERK